MNNNNCIVCVEDNGIGVSDEQIEKTTTIAAHFDSDEYTPEELDEIKAFAEFVKSKRK